MIFHALIELYDRLAGTSSVPPYGFSKEDIGFVVNIDKNGNMLGQPEDLRTKLKANTYEYRTSEVPYTNQVNVRSSTADKTPNFMVDKAHYIFGMSGKKEKPVHHQSFIELIEEISGNSEDEGVVAVKNFLGKWQPNEAGNLEDWKEISGPQGKWVAFRVEGDRDFVHERPGVKELWKEHLAKKTFPKGVNFIDGQVTSIQPQYAQFKFGSGASLVSFNKNAFESYGKKKGENAPISVEDEFKSSTALKHLLRSETQRLRIAGDTVLFWAQKETEVESFLGQILNPSLEEQEAAQSVEKFLQSVRTGRMPADIEKDADTKFYMLGFCINKARIAIRFWYVSTVENIMRQLKNHFDCLEMERGEKDIEFPGIWHLLKETARQTKNISPVLGGALARSILTGRDYPQNLYQGVLGRMRADSNINYLRSAILKAVLTRNHKKEIPMTLDKNRQETPYLLGRLFAVLEKAQMDALGKVNATIKDRFFSSAATTPASVFPRLLRLSQHHIEKADYGHISDRRISEIMENIDRFPGHLNLEDQGVFAIAYYQQKNDLWRKKQNQTEGEE